MTTDEFTTNDGSLDNTALSNDITASTDYTSDEEELDSLESTGILDRKAVRKQLIAQTPEIDAATQAQPVSDEGDVSDSQTTDEDTYIPELVEDEVSAEEDEPSETPDSDPDATTLYDWHEDVPTPDAPLSDVPTPEASPAQTPQGSRIPSVRAGLLNLPSLDDDGTSADAAEYDPVTGLATDDEDYYDAAPVTPAPGFVVPEERDKAFSKGGRGRRVLKVVGIVSGSLLVVYGIGGLFFSSHFMPNTRVNGEDVSWMSVDDLATHVTEVGQSFQSHVTGDGIDITIPASEIELNYDGTAYGLEAGSQIDPWQWPTRIFSEHDFRAATGITFNQDKLNALVLAAVDAVNANAQPPTNATMAFDEPSQSFVPVPDALGTMVDPATTMATVSDGIRTLQTNITLGDADLTQPIVRFKDDALAAVIDRANGLCKQSIPLRIADRDAGTIDINLMKGWLYTNEHCELLVNVDAVKEWTQGDLSRQFDTAGTERKYTRPDGKEVTVTGGNYGWNLDGEALANLIAQNIQADNVGPIDVPMKSTAVEWNPGGPDWGKRYIDVDMTEQYVRVYGDNGEIVLESPCVTGIPYHATDEGVYTIFEHTANMTLVGLDYNGDGKPDYETPVSYWMPFNGGQGLHDAYWRYGFGGDIWQYDGSHGCVNLPTDVAAQLFDWSHVGDVVVVHW